MCFLTEEVRRHSGLRNDGEDEPVMLGVIPGLHILGRLPLTYSPAQEEGPKINMSPFLCL